MPENDHGSAVKAGMVLHVLQGQAWLQGPSGQMSQSKGSPSATMFFSFFARKQPERLERMPLVCVQ